MKKCKPLKNQSMEKPLEGHITACALAKTINVCAWKAFPLIIEE